MNGVANILNSLSVFMEPSYVNFLEFSIAEHTYPGAVDDGVVSTRKIINN